MRYLYLTSLFLWLAVTLTAQAQSDIGLAEAIGEDEAEIIQAIASGVSTQVVCNKIETLVREKKLTSFSFSSDRGPNRLCIGHLSSIIAHLSLSQTLNSREFQEKTINQDQLLYDLSELPESEYLAFMARLRLVRYYLTKTAKEELIRLNGTLAKMDSPNRARVMSLLKGLHIDIRDPIPAMVGRLSVLPTDSSLVELGSLWMREIKTKEMLRGQTYVMEHYISALAKMDALSDWLKQLSADGSYSWADIQYLINEVQRSGLGREFGGLFLETLNQAGEQYSRQLQLLTSEVQQAIRHNLDITEVVKTFAQSESLHEASLIDIEARIASILSSPQTIDKTKHLLESEDGLKQQLKELGYSPKAPLIFVRSYLRLIDIQSLNKSEDQLNTKLDQLLSSFLYDHRVYTEMVAKVSDHHPDGFYKKRLDDSLIRSQKAAKILPLVNSAIDKLEQFRSRIPVSGSGRVQF